MASSERNRTDAVFSELSIQVLQKGLDPFFHLPQVALIWMVVSDFPLGINYYTIQADRSGINAHIELLRILSHLYSPAIEVNRCFCCSSNKHFPNVAAHEFVLL